MTEHRGTCRRWAVSDGRVALGSIELDGDGSFVAIDTAGRILGSSRRRTAHLYLWCPNALLREGLDVMAAWGFAYKSNIVWHKVRKDGRSDGRGVGFFFRNVSELVLFGVRGKNARTLAPGRRQVNYFATRKREHSRKPDELYPIIEACSPGPYLELFARERRPNWTSWGDEVEKFDIARAS